MIHVAFRILHGKAVGFRITGHAGMAPQGKDILCAAVSSAAQMTANTVTEIVRANAAVIMTDGFMDVTLLDRIDECQAVLSGLRLHIRELRNQYPTRIHLIITEV